MNLKQYIALTAIYLKPQVFVNAFLGFSSGFPLALTASSLIMWLTEVGIDKSTIGYFAAIGVPYAIKFLWAPILDQIKLPLLDKWLGRRRSWLLVTQLLVIACISGMAWMNPTADILTFTLLAIGIAFFSASQDIVIDAYRIERAERQYQAAAVAMYSLGYRLAMLASGAGALFLAQYLQVSMQMDFVKSWQMTYLIMSFMMISGIIATVVIKEPEMPENALFVKQEGSSKVKSLVAWFRHAVINPFADFMQRPGWLHILLFVFLYRLADAYLGVMFNPFMIDLGFTKAQVSGIVKIYGTAATMVGGFIGGILVYRFGMYKTLFTCSILHMFTNLLLVVLAGRGADTWFLTLCISTENGTAGMASVAFLAYLGSLCKVNYTATQYALLSSLAAVARTVFSTSSGQTSEWMDAQGYGWEGFFLFSSLLAIPALSLLWWINRRFGMEIGISKDK